MNYKMTRFQVAVLSWIFSKIFRQSHYHKDNLTRVYLLIREHLDEEFTEDNSPTLDSFSLECFHKSMQTDHFIELTRQKDFDGA